jgi:hypothetical protein
MTAEELQAEPIHVVIKFKSRELVVIPRGDRRQAVIALSRLEDAESLASMRDRLIAEFAASASGFAEMLAVLDGAAQQSEIP